MLMSKDPDAITATWEKAMVLAARFPFQTRRLRLALRLLKNPRAATALFACRRAGRSAMLWAFRVGAPRRP